MSDQSKDTPLFRNKRFMLDEIVIFLEYENPNCFLFSISDNFGFLTVNSLVYFDVHRPGRASSTVKNPKLLEMKNEKKYLGFLIPKNMANF